jgi:hypothetical protein
MTLYKAALVAASLVVLGACSESTGGADANRGVAVKCPVADDSGTINIAPGLSARIIENGYGRTAVNGDYADTNVWLWHFDESADDRRGQFVWESGANPFQFQIGSGQAIKGWDLGMPCMRVGETRELVVAPELAYGSAGRGAAVPPNTPLIFKIELVKLTSPE